MEVQGWQSPRISLSYSLNGSNSTNDASSPPKANHPCASPEFEFWMVRNPAFPTPNLLSADQMFVDGVLLPLRNLQTQDQEEDETSPETPLEAGATTAPVAGPATESEKATPLPSSTSSSSSPFGSKRWKDIFRMGEKKPAKQEEKEKEKEKEKKKERKKSSAELNINIWPFSRSRSAGTSSRPRTITGAGRKAASAPCSRSNSTGESKTKLQMEVEYRPLIPQEDSAKGGGVGRGGGRRWASSPGRPGVYLGRSSPVRQIRRPGAARKKLDRYVSGPEKLRRGGGRATVLNVNVPLCMGYAQHLGCKSLEMDGGGIGTNQCSSSSSAAAPTTTTTTTNPLFNLRAFFSRKVY